MTFVAQLQDEMRTWAGEVVKQAQADILDVLDVRVPVDTGEMRDSRIVTDTSDLSWEVEYPTDIADYNEYGTAPHLIPGNPLLAFNWNGVDVVFRFVNHPGSNKHTGWFSDSINADNWRAALQEAADTTPGLG